MTRPRMAAARSSMSGRLAIRACGSCTWTATAARDRARNLALEQATGEYVWFVDGDDALADGGLAAIAAALAESKPDVLLINWVSSYPDGRTAPNPYASLLPAVPAGGCTLEDQPRLIDLTMTSWSKLFRRDFLAGLGVSFAAGIHEDIQVTCAALLSADMIAAVDTVCYRYRRERKGSAMHTTSLGQLAVFDSYRRVFELVASRDAAGTPVSDALRAAIFERAIWHYTTVLQTTGFGVGRIGLPGLVPRAERQRFFQRMHKDFARYRPASYQHPVVRGAPSYGWSSAARTAPTRGSSRSTRPGSRSVSLLAGGNAAASH